MKRFLGRWLSPEPRETAPSAAAPEGADLSLFDPAVATETVLVTTFAVDPSLLAEIIETTGKRLGRGGRARLVYVTDSADFEPFRRAKVAFEYFPPLIDQRLHAGDLPWQAYLREKWGLLLAKWRPAQIVAYGTPIDGFLAAAPRGGSDGGGRP